MKKLSINLIIIILVILFALVSAFALYEVLMWNLFPWLNLSIIFGSSFLCLIFGLIVKIQGKFIKILIVTMASIQIVISSFLLSQSEMFRTNWHWLFFLQTVVFCSIFWDLFSKKTDQINLLGRSCCIVLLILTFLKFLTFYTWIDYPLIGMIGIILCLLLFNKKNLAHSE
jgi:hypothetical protein